MIKFLLLFILVVAPANAHDLYDMAIGKDYILANGTQCVVTTYTYDIKFRDAIAVPLAQTLNLTDEQKFNCKELMSFASGTVLKAVPSISGTRRTRKIDAITKLKFRVPDKVRCLPPIIKKYRKNSNWHIIEGIPDKTTLCGEYPK